MFWLIGIGALALWTVFNFGIYRTLIRSPKHKPLVSSRSENNVLHRHHNHVVTGRNSGNPVLARKSQSATSTNYSATSSISSSNESSSTSFATKVKKTI